MGWITSTDKVASALERGDDLSVEQLATLCGLAPSQVRTAIARLRLLGKLERVGRTWPAVYRAAATSK